MSLLFRKHRDRRQRDRADFTTGRANAQFGEERVADHFSIRDRDHRGDSESIRAQFVDEFSLAGSAEGTIVDSPDSGEITRQFLPNCKFLAHVRSNAM